MRIIIIILAVLNICGCTFYRHTILTAKGDKLSIPIAGMVAAAKGEVIDIQLDRTVCIGKCKNE